MQLFIRLCFQNIIFAIFDLHGPVTVQLGRFEKGLIASSDEQGEAGFIQYVNHYPILEGNHAAHLLVFRLDEVVQTGIGDNKPSFLPTRPCSVVLFKKPAFKFGGQESPHLLQSDTTGRLL